MHRAIHVLRLPICRRVHTRINNRKEEFNMDTRALYEEVEIEIIRFCINDIITTSDSDDGGYEEEFEEE